MKQVKITRRVRDKFTNEYHTPGDVIEREDARAQDFIAAGVGEFIEPTVKVEKPKKESTKKAVKKTSKK